MYCNTFGSYNLGVEGSVESNLCFGSLSYDALNIRLQFVLWGSIPIRNSLLLGFC